MNTEIANVSKGGSKLKKSPAALTIADVFLISSPLLILAFVLLIEGVPGDILKKPEWSFVSVLLWAESLRDSGLVARSKGIDEEQIAAGNAFLGVFLVLTTLVLVLDFRHSMGLSKVPIEIVYFLKYSWFMVCLVFFSVKRFKRYQL